MEGATHESAPNTMIENLLDQFAGSIRFERKGSCRRSGFPVPQNVAYGAGFSDAARRA